ncbi:MAG TPA: protoporphyrinogen oxidase HemJ [Alphaproteobacteria bacterium]
MFYDYIKAFHIISFTAWMAGMFYLPRLYVYHTEATEQNVRETFKIMERKLLRFIINPAMILTFIFGITLLVLNPGWMQQGWMHTKFLLVFILTAYHGYLARLRKQFERDENKHSSKFYRYLNEVPTLLLIGIVILVVVKPF